MAPKGGVRQDRAKALAAVPVATRNTATSRSKSSAKRRSTDLVRSSAPYGMALPRLARASASRISGAAPVTLSLQKFIAGPSSRQGEGANSTRPTSRPALSSRIRSGQAAAGSSRTASRAPIAIISAGVQPGGALIGVRPRGGAGRGSGCAIRRPISAPTTTTPTMISTPITITATLRAARLGFSLSAMKGAGQRIAVTVDGTAAGERLDRWLAASLGNHSRSRIKALIEAGRVTLAAATITDPPSRVKLGQTYEIVVPEPEPALPEPEPIPLVVLYEDADLIVIDKQAGLAIHPAPGSPSGTLVNALIAHCGASLSGIGGVRRPGIV